jgi:hypothetical protein
LPRKQLKPRLNEKAPLPPVDWEQPGRATLDELLPIATAAAVITIIALEWFGSRGMLLLYGDAVAHLHIARRIFDSRNPGITQLGGVWLPLPHLLLLPFVQRMDWWQTGLAGAWPSMICYIASVVGFYRLARHMLSMRWAMVAMLFFALNPALIYLSVTAMTEPLFLALVIWGTLQLLEFGLALRAGEAKRAVRRLAWLTLLLVAAVYTRYDGWIFAAAVWCIALAVLLRSEMKASAVRNAFIVFTVLLAAAPLGWLAYNAHYFHDPLDFIRGPYSAAAIERRTSPPGADHYRGWHSPLWALLFYTRAAQIDAAAGESGFLVMALAFAGLWAAFKTKLDGRAELALLWFPLPFYVYSVAYGSVPIFIPQLWPHSYYNSRYGMEMLPAFALCVCAALAWAQRRWLAENINAAMALWIVALAAVLLNCGVLFYEKPLVLREAIQNSSTRIPMEAGITRALMEMPPGSPVLMYVSDHPGAVEAAGLPLKQIINESDYTSFQAALAAPAEHAAYVIAIAGDAVDAAVKAHPEGLVETDVLGVTGQPVVRIYESTVYGATGNRTPGGK